MPDSDNVVFQTFFPTLINKNGWVVGFNGYGYSLLQPGQQEPSDLFDDGYPVAFNDNNDLLVGGDKPYLMEQSDPANKKYFLKNDDAGDSGMLPTLAQTEIKSITPRFMSNRAQPPTGSDVEPVLYIIFDAQIRRSAATADWEPATFLLRELSDDSTDLQEMTGLDNMQIVSINANGVVATLGTAASDAGDTDQMRANGVTPPARHIIRRRQQETTKQGGTPAQSPSPTASPSINVPPALTITITATAQSASGKLLGAPFTSVGSIKPMNGVSYQGSVSRDVQTEITINFSDTSTATCKTTFLRDKRMKIGSGLPDSSGNLTWEIDDAPSTPIVTNSALPLSAYLSFTDKFTAKTLFTLTNGKSTCYLAATTGYTTVADQGTTPQTNTTLVVNRSQSTPQKVPDVHKGSAPANPSSYLAPDGGLTAGQYLAKPGSWKCTGGLPNQTSYATRYVQALTSQQ